ncbi:MAG: hypothetical protein GXO10_01920 [Crenarchaeota archaeon]|nr:hypothetical protein [Thermoproteota archaeon]
MREIAYVLLGIAIAGIVIPIFLMLSQGLSKISPRVNISQIPTANGGSSSIGGAINNILHNIPLRKINYNILSFKPPNKKLLNKTIFIVYGPPDSVYGDITYFQIATYSEYRDGSWIIDNSGSYGSSLVSDCPYGACTTSCYSIKLLVKLDYLPHNGYPFILRVNSRKGKILYNRWTNMLKNVGDIREYSICVYVPHVPLYEILNVPLSEYKNIGERLSKYVQVSKNIENILRKYFSPLVSSCRTLRCVIYRILKYIDEHYKYTRYAEIPHNANPILYILHSRRINCLEANTLLVLTLRSFGIPARLVAGFIGSPYSQYQEIKLYYAHAWSQVYVPGVGWIIIDATPGIVKEFISMLQNGVTNILNNIDLSKIDIVNPPNGEDTIIGEIELKRPMSGIYELYVTHLDYYLPNNTWIREKIRFYYCDELNTLKMLIDNNFIKRHYIEYDVHLFIPLRYVPHLDYAVSTEPGIVDPCSNEISSSGATYFKIVSVEIYKSDLITLLNIPLSAYENLNVPKIFLQVPQRDLQLLREVADNVTSRCRTLLCVLRRVYMFVLNRLNPTTMYFTTSTNRNSIKIDIIREVLKENNITLSTSREFFTIANTLIVLLLRARGIPARLAIGLTSMFSGKEGVIRGDVVVWPQVYVPVGSGIWVDLPYQPLIAVIELSRNYYKNITLIVVRGGNWKCTYLPIRTIYSTNIIVRGLPRDVYYRTESYGRRPILCVHAGEDAPIGIYSITINILGPYGNEYLYMNLLIKARTRITIKRIYPTYVSPGSTFIVEGYLTDDKGDPLPGKTVYIYVKTSKNGRIVTTCPGKTLPNGTFRVECYIPENEKLGKYYVEAVFNGSLYYAGSSTDPYIYVSRRPIVVISIPASCVMMNKVSILCITDLKDLNLTLTTFPKITEDLEIQVKGSEYVHSAYTSRSSALRIYLKNIQNFSTILITYPGSRQVSYFNLLINILRIGIRKLITTCKIYDKYYQCYKNSTMIIELESIPKLSYRAYINMSIENKNVIRTVTTVKNNITIPFNNLRPGLYKVSICIRPMLTEEESTAMIPVKILRDPPYVDVIDRKCINIFTTYVKVISLVALRDIKITYDLPSLLTFHINIVGRILDYFTQSPVSSIVCVDKKCVLAKDGSFNIAINSISPTLTISVKPLSKFYANSRFRVVVPMYLFLIPLLLYSSISIISGVIAYKGYKILKRRRRRSAVFYGGSMFHKIRGFIKLLDIREGEPLVWGIGEPLRIEVEAFREGRPVPEHSLVLQVNSIYVGRGKYHEITFNSEGTYEISLYVDNIKICSIVIKVVDYRSEIGRVFENILEEIFGENVKYLTPRQIMNKLIEKGVDPAVAKRIVEIHEKVTYAKQNVDRKIFIEFVTLIRHVDRKYTLAGVPQI